MDNVLSLSFSLSPPWGEVVKAAWIARKQGILKAEQTREPLLKLRNTCSKVDLSTICTVVSVLHES